MKEEIWKDIYYIDSISNNIVDYRGLYQISNIGRVKSVKFNKEKILKKRYNDGYIRVILYKNSTNKSLFVHRLVAHMFIYYIDNKPYINHINGIRDDNSDYNLEWCTTSENMLHKHKYLNPTKVKYWKGKTNSKHIRSVPIEQYDLNNNFIKTWDSISQYIRYINKSNTSNISGCLRNKQKTAYGFIWKYNITKK